MLLSEIWPLPEMGKFLRIRRAKSIDFQSVMLISQGVYEGKKLPNLMLLQKQTFLK